MIINFGSINLDLVYRVATLPTPGETLASTSYKKYLGGKGVNQSIAAQHCGAEVRHIGCVGPDSEWLREQILEFGLTLDGIKTVDTHTGHAVILVDDAAENQIVLNGGSNRSFTLDQIEKVLETADPKTDWVICQNETNLVHELARLARKKNFRTAYSAAPFEANHAIPMLDHIDLLAVNEIEAAALQDTLGKDPRDLGLRYLLVTKGAKGADLHTHNETIHQPAFDVIPQDTTGAGDTFLGAFMAEFTLSNSPAKALRFAAAASAIQVTRAGAAPAIPIREEVLTFLKEQK
jgi:ribokinase